MIFRPDNVEFIGQDNARVVVFRYIIQAKNIKSLGGVYEFESPRNIEVSVKTRSIAAHLRCSSPRDTITFEIDPNLPDRLVFKVQNSEKDSRAEIVLPSPDGPMVDTEDYDQFRWNGMITMSSSLFHDMIRDLSAADPYPPLVHLDCDGYTFRLTADGLMSKVVFTVVDKQNQQPPSATPPQPVKTEKPKEEGGEGEEKEPQNGEVEDAATLGVLFKRAGSNGWPVSASYPISFMQRVVKAKNVCGKISICVRENYPIAFVYHTQIGMLTYIITPRVEDDMGEISVPPGANKRAAAIQTVSPSSTRQQPWQKRRRGGASRRAAGPVPGDSDEEKPDIVPRKIEKKEDEDELADELMEHEGGGEDDIPIIAEDDAIDDE